MSTEYENAIDREVIQARIDDIIERDEPDTDIVLDDLLTVDVVLLGQALENEYYRQSNDEGTGPEALLEMRDKIREQSEDVDELIENTNALTESDIDEEVERGVNDSPGTNFGASVPTLVKVLGVIAVFQVLYLVGLATNSLPVSTGTVMPLLAVFGSVVLLGIGYGIGKYR